MRNVCGTGDYMTVEYDNQKSSCNDGSDTYVVILRCQYERELEHLNRLSTRGIRAVALFLVVSMASWGNLSFLPSPDAVTALLGNPPSSRAIGIVLLLYTFSAIILSLARMASGIEHRSSFSHVGYLTGFYFFYYFCKALGDNYWAVFGAGITILGVESYRIWTFCAEGISRKKEALTFITRTGRPPPDELY